MGEHEHDAVEQFLRHRAIRLRRHRETAELVQQLHDRGNRGVEGVTATDVIGHLGDGLVQRTAQRLLAGIERGNLDLARLPTGSMLVHGAPEPAQEAKRSCTPSSDHSSDCSGGEANMMNRRAVSAPYCSTRRLGSTPFPFDFDMVPMPPHSTGAPSAMSTAESRRPLSSASTRTSAGLKYSMRPDAGRR